MSPRSSLTHEVIEHIVDEVSLSDMGKEKKYEISHSFLKPRLHTHAKSVPE